MAVINEVPTTPTVAVSAFIEMTFVDAEEYEKVPVTAVVGGVNLKSDPP